jgi:hypothetical protein
MSDVDNTVSLTGQHGRDAGKTFKIAEVPPVEMTTFILRLLGAVRMDGVDELRALMEPAEGVDQIDVVMRLLAGCDAMAVRQLLLDMLNYVQVAPDPQHPGMFRKLNDDIRELKTLGEIVGAFVRTNVMSGL